MRRGEDELFPNSKYPEHEPSAQHKPSTEPPSMYDFCDMGAYQQALRSWRQSEGYDIRKDDARIVKLLEEAKFDKGAYDTLQGLGYDVNEIVGGAL